MDITALPVANSIDPVNDVFAIVTNSINTTQQINRNTILGITGSPVGTTDTQTLSGKTLTNPTINSAVLSGTLSGTYTIGGTPTFPASVATLTGTQTLTNKTLTSPTINSPTITNATISADSLSGYTTSNAGTVYGISVSGGQITNAAIANGTIGSAQIATNGVGASNLATSAITLGYAQITGNITTTSTTQVQATGLTSTVTIPSGGRKVKITFFANLQTGTNIKKPTVGIWDGTVGSGTQLNQGSTIIQNSGNDQYLMVMAIVTPAAGSKTYNIGWSSDPGGSVTMTMIGSSTEPAFILVEAI